MHIFAAIVPPPEIRQELEATVAAVAPRSGQAATTEARPPTSHRKETTTRTFLRRRRPATAAGTGHDQLDQKPFDQLLIPVTHFGNLTTADSVRLADELRMEAATWPSPTLHVHGGAALEWAGDLGVWARVEGDSEGLQHIGRSVPPLAQRLSLFVDRRMFRPWLQVGTITDATSAPYLEDLVAALDHFRGTSWQQQHLTLFRGRAEDDEGFDEVEQLALGGSSVC
ncbi:hypothetical protein D9V37_02495 [Nocardioides mangrovicus]|uniref:2'-5' RNA ligase family protein n=1 Tax=Nocardioides mangrovicus TaxID=2478913 RepID=A0A3L8P6I5_9ACTN|nr:hypothetical protein [Nocardioides mangrovicus]RLV50841.1 hypothetical protein D9V37_02495 [Nocardioides mangrovicus]